MIITIFTDASYCDRYKIGTYAIWAKYQGYTLRYSGVFKNRLSCNNYAEAAALANGVHLSIKHFDPPGRTKIIAQTDSIIAIEALSGRALKAGKYADAYNRINEAVIARSLRIEYRHVKGHRGRSDRRSAVNTWCHKQCIRLLREERDKIMSEV